MNAIVKLRVLLVSIALPLAAQTPTAYEKGLALYQEGKPLEAIEPLRQALKATPPPPNARYLLGASLGDAGRCPEALDLLKKSETATLPPELKRSVGVTRVRCAMAVNRIDEAADAIRTLLAQFPRDPDVLYLATHVFSDLSIRASQMLVYSAPGSYQVRQLNAEALETQGQWTQAAEEYRLILAQNPNLPGIHYRIGRLILSAPMSDTTLKDARVEFEAELKINPANPGAHYILGEIARREGDFNQAVEQFAAATKLDAGFADAFIGLGRSLLSARRPAEAVAPLEIAVKLQSPNPITHYYLARAYSQVGRKADAERETALHKQAAEKVRQTTKEIQLTIMGPQRMDPTEQGKTP